MLGNALQKAKKWHIGRLNFMLIILVMGLLFIIVSNAFASDRLTFVDILNTILLFPLFMLIFIVVSPLSPVFMAMSLFPIKWRLNDCGLSAWWLIIPGMTAVGIAIFHFEAFIMKYLPFLLALRTDGMLLTSIVVYMLFMLMMLLLTRDFFMEDKMDNAPK